MNRSGRIRGAITKRRKRLIALLILILVAVAGFDHRLQVSVYQFADIRLPPSFDGFTVTQISDLHGATFGKRQEALVEAVSLQAPDLIILTGDIVDRSDTNTEAVSALLSGIGHIAPIYAVTGNHELDNAELYEELKALYRRYGVTILENRLETITRGGDTIYIGGLGFEKSGSLFSGYKVTLPTPPQGSFSILLHHAANYYDAIFEQRWGYSYLFAGHTHGGIIRLPFVGGLIDNDSRFFPAYDGGIFGQSSPILICSRGLGDAGGAPIPRFYNRPELVSVTFRRA